MITDLITLRLILKDTVKTEKILRLEIKNKIKKLEHKKINELRLLEEKIFFTTLRNKHLGRSSHIIREEEIDLRGEAKKKIEEIEELKEGLYVDEPQGDNTLEDLNISKHEEAAAIAETEQKLVKFGIPKEPIIFLKKSIIPIKYLHLVSEE